MKMHYICKMLFYNKHGDYVTVQKHFFCEQKELNKLVGQYIGRLREKNELFNEYYFNGWEVIGCE